MTERTMPNANGEAALGVAYAETEPEMDALAPGDVLPITLDIEAAVPVVLGALPEIAAIREDMAKTVNVDLSPVDNLGRYARALAHTQALYLAAQEPPQELPNLAARGLELRNLFQRDADALVARKLIDGAPLRNLKGTRGYRNIAFDLLTLVQMLRANWDAIASRTPTEAAELDEAERLADALLTGIGERSQAPASIAAHADKRARAYTLFLNAYEETRHIVQFVRRHHGDADEIAPSVFGGRSGRRRDAAAELPESEAQAAISPTDAELGDSADEAELARRRAALPGGDPFVS